MFDRDRKLLDKVASYYLQYRGVIDVNDLLKYMGEGVRVEVSDLALRQVIHYVLYVITRSAVNSAREALKAGITYRELSYDVDYEAYGVPDVERSSVLYPLGLVAYYNYKEGRNAPELAVLGYLLRKIYKGVSGLREKYEVESERPNYFRYDLEGELKELGELVKEFPQGFYRKPLYTDPPWLITAFKAYFTLKEVESIKVGVKAKANERVLQFMLWKLYELYVFYLVVRVLESCKYTVKKRGSEYIAEKGGKEFHIIMNRSLLTSNLLGVDLISDVKAYRGKPDLTLANKDTVIFECKYSGEANYITAGRFKVMAYVFEYDPLTAILVYPGLKDEVEAYDDEDEETIKLDEIVKERGFVDFRFKGKDREVVIYMARVDPSLDDSENIRVLGEILKRYLEC